MTTRNRIFEERPQGEKMKKTLLVLAALALLAVPTAAGRSDVAAKKGPQTVNVQLVTVSDWHAQLQPINIGTPTAPVYIGGAAALKAYFDQARQANPNTLVFMAGDSWGASPPISSYFADEPAIVAMNMMGIDADTLGNHSFDRGIAHLQSQIDLAQFPFVAANLENLDDNLSGVTKRRFFELDGIRVAVIGIVNEEAPTLVAPGALGTIEITDSIDAANKAARQARNAGAQVVVVLTHKGIRGITSGTANGELIDFANGVDASLVDVIVGDHTNFTYSGLHQGGKILVVENLSKGAQFAKIQLTVDRDTGVTAKSATFHQPLVAAVTPDAAIVDYIAGLDTIVRPVLETEIGQSTVAIPRSDSCGRADSRLCESRVGNVVTDALRSAYGTDFALTNSGGLRADLTCPGAGAAGYCPPAGPVPPYPITRGSVLGVLPFGNFSVQLNLTGAELKQMLEHAVSSMPSANGRFAQVSGFCFAYDIAAAVGARVQSIVRQATDGSCSATLVDPAATYSLATNDFTASGGDGYPSFLGRFSSAGVLLDEDLATYVAARGTVSPAIQGRIVCTDSNGVASPNCPAVTAP